MPCRRVMKQYPVMRRRVPREFSREDLIQTVCHMARIAMHRTVTKGGEFGQIGG